MISIRSWIKLQIRAQPAPGQPLRHLRNRIAQLSDLRDRIALKIISEIAGPHHGLLASKLGKKASTNLGAIQVAATAWQGHSVRGVTSGMLVKTFGLQIVSEKVDGRGRVYRTTG